MKNSSTLLQNTQKKNAKNFKHNRLRPIAGPVSRYLIKDRNLRSDVSPHSIMNLSYNHCWFLTARVDLLAGHLKHWS
jgi:hypothetical protein